MRRPQFIARQSGGPAGLLGRIVASVMERETAQINRHAIALLDIDRGGSVLDVGAGSGLSLRLLAERFDEGLVVGVDHSPVMCRRALKKNRSLIAEGRVRVECARSDDLPFETGMFDAVMSVHTLYFWDPAEPHLREIARVMRPGGRLVLAFRSADDPTTAAFPESVYRFRSLEDVERLVLRCGFDDIRLEKRDDATALLSVTRARTLLVSGSATMARCQ